MSLTLFFLAPFYRRFADLTILPRIEDLWASRSRKKLVEQIARLEYLVNNPDYYDKYYQLYPWRKLFLILACLTYSSILESDPTWIRQLFPAYKSTTPHSLNAIHNFLLTLPLALRWISFFIAVRAFQTFKRLRTLGNDELKEELANTALLSKTLESHR